MQEKASYKLHGSGYTVMYLLSLELSQASQWPAIARTCFGKEGKNGTIIWDGIIRNNQKQELFVSSQENTVSVVATWPGHWPYCSGHWPYSPLTADTGMDSMKYTQQIQQQNTYPSFMTFIYGFTYRYYPYVLYVLDELGACPFPSCLCLLWSDGETRWLHNSWS